ncbi:MAG: lipid A biosynthesis lauroyl acyltransferase [SAR92 clade bacterium]|uniref:Lipid A biosynthesis lauroyl acyltransferase n=1 Tax=SAR92 clade bacterium TaxID=2315479 RepID=A0A520MFR4_9GAMM|nr:MAG: lipid A biosynthesis lauroyl acyltransferase [SAR92 clade bacterium]
MRNILVLWLLKLVSILPLGIARIKGAWLGRLLTIIRAQPSRIARINLSLCYPHLSDDEVKWICNMRMRHLAQAVLETPKVWRKGNPWVSKKVVAVKGLGLFEQAIADDRGTILIIPHQGNWEVLGLWAGEKKAMTSLYDPPRMIELETWIKTSREQSGATLVPTNVRGVSALIKALKRGEMTGILPDQQPPPESGEFVPLLGVEVRTMTLIHKLLQRSGSQALMATALRVPGGWELHFVAPAQDIYSTDEVTSLLALNKGIEDIIALAPEQYQWEYKRFRERPKGMDPIYD